MATVTPGATHRCRQRAGVLLFACAALVLPSVADATDTRGASSIVLVRFSMPERPFEVGSRLVLAHCQLPFSVRIPMRRALQQFDVPAGRYYVSRIETRFWIFEPKNPRPPKDPRLSISVPARSTVYVGDFRVDDSFRPSVRVAYTQQSLDEMAQMFDVHQ
jgi:hypothetical protein